jgi:hypothetical protein
VEQLEYPEEIDWQHRRDWFEETQAGYAEGGSRRPSEQALALMVDLQAVFCAGAWAATIVLSAAIVECQARALGLRPPGDWVPGISRKDLTWLHSLRNRLLHEPRGNPALTIQDQWLRRREWEGEARRALHVVFQALYPANTSK